MGGRCCFATFLSDKSDIWETPGQSYGSVVRFDAAEIPDIEDKTGSHSFYLCLSNRARGGALGAGSKCANRLYDRSYAARFRNGGVGQDLPNHLQLDLDGQRADGDPGCESELPVYAGRFPGQTLAQRGKSHDHNHLRSQRCRNFQ